MELTKEEAVLKAVEWFADDPYNRINRGHYYKKFREPLHEYLRTQGYNSTLAPNDLVGPLRKHSKISSALMTDIHKGFPASVHYTELIQDLKKDIERNSQRRISTEKRKRTDSTASVEETTPKRSSVDLLQQVSNDIQYRSASMLAKDSIARNAIPENSDSTEFESVVDGSNDPGKTSSQATEALLNPPAFSLTMNRSDTQNNHYLSQAKRFITDGFFPAPTEQRKIRQTMLYLQRSITSAVTKCLSDSGINPDQFTQLTPSIYQQPLRDLIKTVLGRTAEGDLRNVQLIRSLKLSTFLQSLIAADITRSTLEPLPHQYYLQHSSDSSLATTIRQELGDTMLERLEAVNIENIIHDQFKPNVNKQASILADQMLSKLSVFLAGPSLHEPPLSVHDFDDGMPTFQPATADASFPHHQPSPSSPRLLPPPYHAIFQEELEAIYKLALNSRADWAVTDSGGVNYAFRFPPFRMPFNPEHHKAVRYQDDNGNDVDDGQVKHVFVTLTPLVLAAYRTRRGQEYEENKVVCQAVVHTYPDPRSQMRTEVGE